MHRRQAIREAVAAALIGITARVDEERAARVHEETRPLIVVHCRVEALDVDAGTMGLPEDERDLTIGIDIYTDGATGKAAVDAINDLEVDIGVRLGAAMMSGFTLNGLVRDMRWSSTEITVEREQERYLALGTVAYTAAYQVWFGNPQ